MQQKQGHLQLNSIERPVCLIKMIRIAQWRPGVKFEVKSVDRDFTKDRVLHTSRAIENE